LMVATIAVRQLPPSDSRSTSVMRELRYGTWPLDPFSISNLKLVSMSLH
jgi:hypothetical protein